VCVCVCICGCCVCVCVRNRERGSLLSRQISTQLPTSVLLGRPPFEQCRLETADIRTAGGGLARTPVQTTDETSREIPRLCRRVCEEKKQRPQKQSAVIVRLREEP